MVPSESSSDWDHGERQSGWRGPVQPRSQPAASSPVIRRRDRTSGEPVANAGHRHDQARVLRISLDFAVQPADARVDAAIGRLGLATGHRLKQVVSRRVRPSPRTNADNWPGSKGVSARSFPLASISVRGVEV